MFDPAVIGLLSAPRWLAHFATEQSIADDNVVIVDSSDSNTEANASQVARFVRIQVHDASTVLLVSVGNSASSPPDPNAASIRIHGQSSEVFQCPPGGRPIVKLKRVSDTVKYSLLWGK